MKTSFRIFVCVCMAIFWGLLALGACLIVTELCTRSARACVPTTFPAAPIRANAARIVREPAPDRASVESPVCPAQRCASAAAPSDVPSASVRNPAIAGSLSLRGPGAFLGFHPVKQYAVPNHAATLPAVAG